MGRLKVALAALAVLVHAGQSAKRPFLCSEYDDDSEYSASSCHRYDGDTCDAQCWKNSTCDVLCGGGNTSCADGGGAVCALKRLADIDATCASLESLAAGDGSAPTSSRRALRAEAPEHHAPSTGGLGCDNHAYCEFCVGFASCEYLIEHHADYVQTTNSGFGPIALQLLRNMSAICANRSASLGEYADADDYGIWGQSAGPGLDATGVGRARTAAASYYGSSPVAVLAAALVLFGAALVHRRRMRAVYRYGDLG